jgi:hypothetical protein
MTATIVLAAGLVTVAGTQPQLAASGDQVYLAVGAGNTISVARSDDGGATFAAPVALPAAGVLSLGRHRGPRIAATARAVVVTAVAGAKGGGADGDLLAWRSTDRGRTWSAPVTINRVRGAAREGLHGFAADPSGLLVLAWLDLRDQGTRLYAALSRDDGATWSPDRLVYASPSGTICQCCHPSVAIGPGGRIVVMFRNSLDGRRDLYVTESRDGETFAPPVKQGVGSWRLDACPMDGGAIVAAADGVTSIWRREGDVFLVSGRGPESRLGAGHDPTAAGSAHGVDAAWTAPQGIAVRMAGAAPAVVGPGGFASLLARRDTLVVASEHDGRTEVRVLRRPGALSARPAARP